MREWEKKFEKSVLERGKALLFAGRVKNMKENISGCSAAVLGRQRYEVSVKMKEGRPVRISCQCPVAKAGNFCEHMAAVLYASDVRAEAVGLQISEQELMELWQRKDAELREQEASRKQPSGKRKTVRSEEENKKRQEQLRVQAEKEAAQKEEDRKEQERLRVQAEKEAAQKEENRKEQERLRVQAEKEAAQKEERRLAREKRKIEKAKKEAEKKAKAEETRRQAEEIRRAEEERREAVRRQKEEEARKRELKRLQEEEATRLAQKRKEEEEKQQKMVREAQQQTEERAAIETAAQKEAELKRLQANFQPLQAETDPSEITKEVKNTSLVSSDAASISSLEHYSYFDGARIKRSLALKQDVIKSGEALLSKNKVEIEDITTGYLQSGNEEVVGQVQAVGKEGRQEFPIQLLFNRTEVLQSSCQCSVCRKDYNTWYNRKTGCAYTAAVLKYLDTYLGTHNIGDATDKTAHLLLNQFRDRRSNRLLADAAQESDDLSLVPRLIRKNEELLLSFRFGSGKLFVVKSLSDFYRNVKNSSTDIYGTSTKINHSREHFREDSLPWLSFACRYIKEELKMKQRLMEDRYYYGRASGVGDSIPLFGGRLDEFYELLSGSSVKEIEYENRDAAKKTKQMLSAAVKNPKIQMSIMPQKSAGKKEFHGIEVEGSLPKLYYGENGAYFLEETNFCRASGEFGELIRPFVNSSEDGVFSFTVGRSHLAEFYYQVLPSLGDIVSVTETDTQKIHSYLPPEANFVFYLDAVDEDVTCRVHAVYGDREVSVLDVADEQKTALMESYRDHNREEEILFQVYQWFDMIDAEQDELTCSGNEEKIYRIMEDGIDALLMLGEVRCTDRFRSRQIIRRVKVAVGVSVSGGMLDLDITTEDIPASELLELLESYRQKKKYYRLKNGSFVSMEDSSIQMLSEMMDTMHIKPKDFVKGKMQLPAYRTLYLDRMLEENDNVYSHRDSHFREIAKGFKTVSDSDFEEPKSLSGIMRNYQKNGYKWLRTLEQWKFGGILADDMGLGKTLQAIAVLLAAKEEGRTGTSLIVTPASLVYNWAEELHRFAPDLTVTQVTGNASQRQDIIAAYQNFDVMITSYDLLKRDIAVYEEKQFQYEIIDEAQYIKNHTTSAAKAVKVIRSETRFALTGTPIENRLSELWSIFDYLMPGFLYSYDVFRREMETPIVKNKEENVMQRLQKMVSPFILRRLKEQVLKDLPEKLEEVRYVRFEDAQQKLYDAQVLHMKELIARQDDSEFSKNKMQLLAELTRLRQICCDPSLCFENYHGEAAKAEAALELVASALDGGHRILLFSQFTSMLEILQKRLEAAHIPYYTITGATPKEKRLELVKEFNEGTVPVFLISLKAGGVGLNLTGADVVLHYDPWWNLAAQNQATDRAHRIGQTKKVTVYKMIAKNTIEEKILKLQESKRDLADQVIGAAGGELGSMSREELLALLDGNV